MAKRVPPSMRTRQSLSDVIEGRLSSPAGREELVKLATRLIIEEMLEAAARDAVGGSGHKKWCQSLEILRLHFLKPCFLFQYLLYQQGIDVNHADLQKMQGENGNFLVFLVVDCDLAALPVSSKAVRAIFLAVSH
jgi:hypothetical protein